MKRLFYSFAIILSVICLFSCESEDALEPDYKNPSDYFQPDADDNSEEAQLRRKFFADHGSYLLFNDTLQNVYLGKDIPISKSPSSMRDNCSKTSLTPDTISCTCGKMNFR